MLIRIVLADDHSLVRSALGERLNTEKNLEVVATVSGADEAVQICSQRSIDIVLMDIDMPGLSAFEAAQTINSRFSQTKVIFLSAFHHDAYIEQALHAKAWGFVCKNEPIEAVIQAITQVSMGNTWFSKQVQERIVVHNGTLGLSHSTTSRISLLTPREIQVLSYVALGMPKRDIAQTMHLSVKTVENHCTNLMNKLSIHDRVELARFAIREGLAEA